MPIQNVDPDLLEFGRAVAVGLRRMAADMRGVGINTASANVQIAATNYSYFTDWLYVDAQQRAVRAKERADGVLSARGTFEAIENEAARVRHVLTERYNVAF